MHVTLARRPRRGGCVPAWTLFAIARPPPSPSLLSPSSPSLQSPRGPRGAHLVIPLALDPVIQNTTPRRLLLPSRFSPLPLPPHALPHPSRPVASPLPLPRVTPFPPPPPLCNYLRTRAPVGVRLQREVATAARQRLHRVSDSPEPRGAVRRLQPNFRSLIRRWSCSGRGRCDDAGCSRSAARVRTPGPYASTHARSAGHAGRQAGK